MNVYERLTIKKFIREEVETQLQQALYNTKEETGKIPRQPAYYKLLVKSIVNQLELLMDHLKELDELCEKCHGCSQCPLGETVKDYLCIRSILHHEEHTIEEFYDLCKQRAERRMLE
jgi:hypothetical protein